MTDPLFEAGDGNTPVDEDEAEGLRLSWIRTRQELNDADGIDPTKIGRAAADYLAESFGADRPTWGIDSGLDGAELRRRYVTAL